MYISYIICIYFYCSYSNVSLMELQPFGLAKGDAATYLGGLLWCLETYQHGCSVDYGYDYGKRAAPASIEVSD